MINYWAVILATVVGYVIPSVWYTVIFGKQWMKLSGVKKDKNAKMGASTIIGGLITTFIFNYILAWVIGFTGAATFVAGAIIGATLWLGFIATTMFGAVLYEKRPFALYLINTIVYLISMAIGGGILAVWK